MTGSPSHAWSMRSKCHLSTGALGLDRSEFPNSCSRYDFALQQMNTSELRKY